MTGLRTVALSAALMAFYAALLTVQPRPIASQPDVVKQLLPDGGIPKEITVKPEQRDRIIVRLKTAQRTSDLQRAQQVAFLLAALDSAYDRNRDYLLHVMSGCDYPEIRYGCDEMTGFYLIYLWQHGHAEILAPLLKFSVASNDAAGSEGLGAFFGDLAQNSPAKFLDAVRTFPILAQKNACYFAGLSDGGGMGANGLARARKGLRRIGSEIALRCLKEIEDANKSQ